MKDEIIVSLLLSCGAAFIYIVLIDKSQNRLKHAWYVFSIVAVVTWIPINLYVQRHNNALLHAIIKGNIALVENRIAEGGDVKMRLRGGATLLHALAYNNDNTDIAKLLINLGVQLDSRDTDGNTAYDVAVSKNRVKLIKYFISIHRKKS